MKRRLPPLNALRAFEVVTRHTRVRDAARELHVTAAAVGQQIKALEDHLGRKLLRRHRAGYLLTDDGAAGVTDLRAAFEHLSASVSKMSQGSRSALTVTIVPSLASTWLVPRLHVFERQYPDIDLLLHSSEQLVDLESSSVDVAIRFGGGVYPRTNSVRLFDSELFPVCSPQLLRRHNVAARAPAELLRLPLLDVDWIPPSRAIWPDWSNWLKAAGVETSGLRRRLRFSDGALAVQAAVEGQGVALATAALLGDHLRAGRLIRLFKVSLRTDFGYYLSHLSRRAEDPNIVAFRDWALAEAQQSLVA